MLCTPSPGEELRTQSPFESGIESVFSPPQTSSDVHQMRLLGKMLSATWQDGAVWGAKACRDDGDPWPVSALHGCWWSLGAAFIERGHPLDAVRLMDHTANRVALGQPSPLKADEISAWMDRAAGGTGPGQRRDSILMPCLGMISPCRLHRLQANRALEVRMGRVSGGPVLSHR